MAEGERIERKLPRKVSRRTFFRDAGIAIGAILAGLAGVEIATHRREKAPDFGEHKDDKYYTVLLEHGEEKFGHIRKDPHMQGEIIGEIPTNLGLTVDNARKVHGSSTGAAHEIIIHKDGQSTGLWWEGDWPSRENPKEKIRGFVSSQFTSKVGESYNKPKE